MRTTKADGGVLQRAEARGQRAAEALGQMIADSGLSIRAVEALVGWGQGTLNAVLAGRTALRVYHVYAIAEVCGLSVGRVFMDLAGGGEEGGGGGTPRGGGQSKPGTKPRPTIRPEIVRLVQEEAEAAVRRLLEQEAAKKQRGKKP